MNTDSNKMIDLLINNINMDDFLICNGKIKKFCPFGFFNNGANDRLKQMEVINDGRK